jgi:MFS family permease
MLFFSQKRKLGRTAFLPHTPLFRVQANARGRIMASSLQPQLQMLISENDYCGNLSTSYLRSILDSAYAFGGTTGIFWGYLADRMGRRRVTLMGLWAMFICCLSMGFATSLASCTIFRYFAGLASSTVMVTTLTMLGDLSQSTSERATSVSRLPLIALLGSIGPIMQEMVSESLRASGAVWEKYPMLGSQLACGSLILSIAVAATAMLEEVSKSAGPALVVRLLT